MCCKMKYKIGIVGAGIVGNAVKYGMERLGHNVYVHDIKFDTKLEQLLNTDLLYLCSHTFENCNRM